MRFEMPSRIPFEIHDGWWEVATVLTALLGGLLLLHVHRLNAFRAASVRFRGAVVSALGQIYPDPAVWPQDIDGFLRKLFPQLQAAVAEFRPFVPWYCRRAFDQAWFRYRCATGRKIDIQCYHHYMAFSGQPDPRRTFRENVDHLLSFAKEP